MEMRHQESLILSYSVLRALLFFFYGRSIRPYTVMTSLHELQAKIQRVYWTSGLRLRKPAFWFWVCHWSTVFLDQLFSNLEDNQNLEKHLTYLFPNGIWLSRLGWTPGISILMIFSSRFDGLLTSVSHPNHSFLLCKVLLAWVTQQIC